MTLRLSLLRALRGLALLPFLLLALAAQAGSISFDLAITDARLRVVNRGDSTAFHPQVLRLQDNGKWVALAPVAGAAPAEMLPQAALEVQWPPQAPAAPESPASLRPVMVRFFDQAGTAFGQITFFDHPLPADDAQILQAGYDDGRLTIAPPASAAVTATWLLWAQENGITALREPMRPAPPQPDARRIDWTSARTPQEFDLGNGMPTVFLLHQTPSGWRSQLVAKGVTQGRQQRAAWLDLGRPLRIAALLALLAGLSLLTWNLIEAQHRPDHA